MLQCGLLKLPFAADAKSMVSYTNISRDKSDTDVPMGLMAGRRRRPARVSGKVVDFLQPVNRRFDAFHPRFDLQ